jgi:ferredoxin
MFAGNINTHINLRLSVYPESSNYAALLPDPAFSSALVDGIHGKRNRSPRSDKRRVTFVDRRGQQHNLQATDGDSLLDVARASGLDLEGACGGSCSCSTCHAIVKSDEYYHKTGQPSEDEHDMLDLAFGLTETSRLACQVRISKELDGLVVGFIQGKHLI